MQVVCLFVSFAFNTPTLEMTQKFTFVSLRKSIARLQALFQYWFLCLTDSKLYTDEEAIPDPAMTEAGGSM